MTEIATFVCPRRGEGFTPPPGMSSDDYWRPDGTCRYCGSISPDKFFEAVEAGAEVVPTDKTYKVYVGQKKFYFQHLSKNERNKFIELHNSHVMKLAFPGHFYTRPYFCKEVPA